MWFFSPSFDSATSHSTNYYDLLGQGFLRGKPYLWLEPDPRLAELENPYSPSELGSIPVLHDATYFRGRYYLYFGPLPGAIAAAVRAITGVGIGDDWLTFAGIAGLFLASADVLARISRMSYSHLPQWVILPGLAVAGLASPMLWILNYPAYNSAAVACGAFFLMAGLATALSSLASVRHRRLRWLLASTFWSFAAASRIISAPAVIVFSLAMAIPATRERALPTRARILGLTALTLPLAVTAGLLALYNIVRFGDPLETGLRYQMAGTDYTSFDRPFSASYVAFNAYNYMWMPPRMGARFPFLHARSGTRKPPLLSPAPSSMHDPEQVTGLLLTTPFLLFAGYTVARAVCGVRPCADHVAVDAQARSLPERRLAAHLSRTLLVAALSLFAPLLLFFYVSMRYLLDLSPMLAVVASVGSWIAMEDHRDDGRLRRLVELLAILSALVSVVFGVLLALSDSPALAMILRARTGR